MLALFKPTLIAAFLAGLMLTIGTTQAGENYKLQRAEVSETLALPRKSVAVLDSEISYLEIGEGAPVLFIHGNPTSAYLWRNVVPYVADSNRAIAVDLIGMGRSGKPAIGYTFTDHAAYLEAFVDALELEQITLVGHDWGAALAWNYARRNPDKVERLVFMEGVLPPVFPQPSFEAMGEEMGSMFRALNDPEQEHAMVIDNNMFVEQVLPGFIVRTLGAEAKKAYGAPYLNPAHRAPTLAWPREVPIAGEPAVNVDALKQIEVFMSKTEMPVLLAYAEPGVLITPETVGWYVDRIPNLETAFIGQGLHFIQEDQPDAIGRAISDWMRRNR